MIGGDCVAYYRSAKRQVFIEEYLKCWNATEAARRAGYKWPRRRATCLLDHPQVQEALQRRIDELAMDANEVLLRLAEHARGDLGEFLEIQPDGSARIDFRRAREAGKLHLLKRFSQSKQYGTQIELYDAQSALQLLGKHLGLFREQVEVTGQIDINGIREQLIDRINRIAASRDADRVPEEPDG